MVNEEIKQYMNGPVTFDEGSGMFFSGDRNMIAQVRGWGHIQNMFKKGNDYDLDAAAKFQDEIGRWIADAINEKLKSTP